MFTAANLLEKKEITILFYFLKLNGFAFCCQLIHETETGVSFSLVVNSFVSTTSCIIGHLAQLYGNNVSNSIYI